MTCPICSSDLASTGNASVTISLSGKLMAFQTELAVCDKCGYFPITAEQLINVRKALSPNADIRQNDKPESVPVQT